MLQSRAEEIAAIVTDAGDSEAPPAVSPPDREMRCVGCGTRVFTSRAPELVANWVRCPRCKGALKLMPACEPVEDDATAVAADPHRPVSYSQQR
jgi:hypothetical protein